MIRKRSRFIAPLVLSLFVSNQLLATDLKNSTGCPDGSCRSNPVIDSKLTEEILKTLRTTAQNQNVGATNYVGSYDDVQNLIGYVDLDPKSDVYKGLMKTSSGVDGVYDPRTPSRQLDETFLTKPTAAKPGRIDETAVRGKIRQIEDSYKNSFISFCNQESQKQKASGKGVATSDLVCENMWQNRETTYAKHEFVKDWKKAKLTIARGIAIKKLEEAIEASKALDDVNLRDPAHTNSPKAHAVYAKLFDGLAIQAAITDFDPKEPKTLVGAAKQYLGFVTTTLSIKANRREAANLVAPAGSSSMFISPAQLDQMKKAGQDTSKLDPVNSGAWRKPDWDISSYDLATYGRSTEAAVGKAMLDPTAIPDVEFEELPDTAGSSPKFTGKINGREYKVKFTSQMDGPLATTGLGAPFARGHANGSEVRTENVVNPIAAAIGYSVDPTYYKKSARVFLDKGPKDGESKEEYRARFEKKRQEIISGMKRGSDGTLDPRGAWKHEVALGNVQFDEASGRYFIVLNDVSLEMKSKRDTGIKVGLGTKEDFGRSEKREYRGLTVLSALFADNDTKAKNSDISMIPDSNGDIVVAHRFSDMGAALGGLLVGKGRVNDYSPNLVSKAGNGVVETSFRTKHWQPIYGQVTLDDARWVMRRVAQLTPEQIKATFKNAGSDDAEAQLYTDKFLRRRDQLVQALFSGADQTFVADKSGRTGALVASTSKMSDPAKYTIPGFVEGGKLVKLDQPHADSERATSQRTVASELFEAWKNSLTALGVNEASNAIQRINIGNFLFSGQKVDPVTGEVVRSAVRGAIHACLPARVSVPNRGADKDVNPWMILDIYQVGPGLTTRPSPRGDQSKEDISIGYVKEVIIMRPAKQPDNGIGGRLAMFKNSCDPTKLERELDEATLKSMKPGDKLMVNKYKFAGGSIDLSTNGPNASLLQEAIGPEAYLELGMKGELFDSALFKKTAENKIEAAWTDESRSEKVATAGVRFLAMRFPIVGVAGNKSDTEKRIFEFDMSDSKQAALLSSSLQVSLPKELENSMQPKESLDKKVQGRHALFSLFGFWEKRAGSERISGHYENASGVSRDVHAARRISTTAQPYSLATQDKIFEATIIDDLTSANQDSLNLQVRVNYDKQYASNKDWGKLQKGLVSLFPAQAFAGNTAKTVDPAMGSLKLKGSITFPQEALAHALSSKQSADGACSAFEQTLRAANGAMRTYSPRSLCEQLKEKDNRGQLKYSNYDAIEKAPISAMKDGRPDAGLTRELKDNLKATLSFREAFTKAQQSYAQYAQAQAHIARSESPAIKAQAKAQADKAARDTVGILVKMLNDNPSPPMALNALANMSPAQSFCRHAVASSEEAFENQEGSLMYTDMACGKILAKTMTVDEALKDSTAADYEMVAPFAFDYFQRAGRRGGGYIRSPGGR